MNKIKNIYLLNDDEMKILNMNQYNTGLFLEKEDGSFVYQSTSDPVKPFSDAKQDIAEELGKMIYAVHKKTLMK